MTEIRASEIQSSGENRIHERRSEPRFPVNQRVEVTLLGDPAVAFTARLTNVSSHGLRILSAQKLAPGTAVRVDIEDAEVLGEVRYCASNDDAYGLGIVIYSPSNPSGGPIEVTAGPQQSLLL